MQQLMQYRFYDLGAKLYGIFNAQAHGRVADLFGPLTDAQKSLDALIKGDPITLRTAKPEAIRLLAQISALFDKYYIDQTSRQLRAPGSEEKVEPQELALINLALEKFESALAAELSNTVVYAAVQRGIYSAVDMVENAHRAIPEEMQSFLTAPARRELDAAGRALGFDLGTAATMHMLRALEMVTASYYALFATQQPGRAERNFATYLRKLSALVEDDDAQIRPDAQLVQILTQIKDNYRNPLIAAESVTSTGSAATLFGLVTSVIMQLLEQIADHKDRSLEAPAASAQAAAQEPSAPPANNKSDKAQKANDKTVVSPIMQEEDQETLVDTTEDNGEDEEDIYDFRVSQAG